MVPGRYFSTPLNTVNLSIYSKKYILFLFQIIRYLTLGQVNSDGTTSHPTAVACTLISPLDRDID